MQAVTNSDYESDGSRDHFVNHPFEIAPYRLAAAVLLLELARRDSLDSIARLIVTRNEVHDDAIRAQPLVSAIKADDLAEVRRLINAGSAVNGRLPMVGGPTTTTRRSPSPPARDTRTSFARCSKQAPIYSNELR